MSEAGVWSRVAVVVMVVRASRSGDVRWFSIGLEALLPSDERTERLVQRRTAALPPSRQTGLWRAWTQLESAETRGGLVRRNARVRYARCAFQYSIEPLSAPSIFG